MQLRSVAMHDHDEGDSKKPQPVRSRRKGDNAPEAQEYDPREVGPRGKDRGDDHRHVIP